MAGNRSRTVERNGVARDLDKLFSVAEKVSSSFCVAKIVNPNPFLCKGKGGMEIRTNFK